MGDGGDDAATGSGEAGDGGDDAAAGSDEASTVSGTPMRTPNGFDSRCDRTK